MREVTIEQALTDGVEALGGTCEKFVTPGKKGPPDRLICWSADGPEGLYISERRGSFPVAEFAETKTIGGKLESWQARDHARRRKMGFPVYVLWTLEQVEAYLVSRGKKP